MGHSYSRGCVIPLLILSNAIFISTSILKTSGFSFWSAAYPACNWKMATLNPFAKLTLDTLEASRQLHLIGGIEVDVYGKTELLPNVRDVACLWLLNPRLCCRQDMKPIADAVIAHWKKQNNSDIGIIVAAFDQRNHGSRLINSLSNESWRDGNPRHAQDMFSIYRAFRSLHGRFY